MQTDGLVTDGPESIRVLEPGRLLIRNICMVFDAYLAKAAQRERFSKAI